MLGTVKFHTDVVFGPAHINASEGTAEAVSHDDLGHRARESAAYQQQPRAGFLRRLRAAVHQCDRAA